MKCGWLLTSDEYRLICYNNNIVSSYRLCGISMELTGKLLVIVFSVFSVCLVCV